MRPLFFPAVVLAVLSHAVGYAIQAQEIAAKPTQVSDPQLRLTPLKSLEKFEPATPVTMTFRRANFPSGHDLKEFAAKLGIDLQTGDVEQ